MITAGSRRVPRLHDQVDVHHVHVPVQVDVAAQRLLAVVISAVRRAIAVALRDRVLVAVRVERIRVDEIGTVVVPVDPVVCEIRRAREDVGVAVVAVVGNKTVEVDIAGFSGSGSASGTLSVSTLSLMSGPFGSAIDYARWRNHRRAEKPFWRAGHCPVQTHRGRSLPGDGSGPCHPASL